MAMLPSNRGGSTIVDGLGRNRSVSNTASGNRFSHIDALRALAVGVVVLAHAGLANVFPSSTGVTVFFTISGFIITHLIIREVRSTGRFSATAFYRRRLYKLGPPFLVIIGVPSVVYWLQGGNISPYQFASQFLFAFNWFYAAGNSNVSPGTNVVWSLAIEEQFYIAFSVLMLLAHARFRRALWWGSCLAIVGSCAFRAWIYLHDDSPADLIFYSTGTRVDSIAVGVCAALILDMVQRPNDNDLGALRSRVSMWLGQLSRSNWCLLASVCLFAVSVVVRSELYKEVFRFSVESFAAALFIAFGMLRTDGFVGRLLHRVCAFRPLRTIGLASYSIYLVHLQLIRALRPALASWSPYLSITLMVGVGTVSGLALWFLVEVPILKLSRRKRGSKAVLVNGQ